MNPQHSEGHEAAGERHKSIALEGLLWTCSCGVPMELGELKRGKRMYLDCRHCGYVATVRIYTGALSQAPDKGGK